MKKENLFNVIVFKVVIIIVTIHNNGRIQIQSKLM